MPGLELVNKTLMITVFVTVMMLLVEYLNVQTRGLVLDAFGHSRWRQYVVAALLGAIPGCLGAYAVVALYVHRRPRRAGGGDGRHEWRRNLRHAGALSGHSRLDDGGPGALGHGRRLAHGQGATRWRPWQLGRGP
ncbi:MAG: hypothetical protein JRH20_15900 [Deltaproteobacteria bacterium]|nr:hypothetical protein [Deltaproteobacteria bacterium]